MRQWLWLWLWLYLTALPVLAQGGGGGNRAESSRVLAETNPRPWSEFVQIEVDRAFRHTTVLLNLFLLVLILLPVATGLGLWWLRRSIVIQLVQTATERAQKQIQAQAEITIAEVLAQHLTHYQITLAALNTQSRQTLEQEWQKRLTTFCETTERVSLAPPSPGQVLPQLRHWLTHTQTELAPELYQHLVDWLHRDWAALTGADCLLLGQVWQRLGQWEKALPYYQQASQQQPESWETWYHLGLALNHLHRYTEALTSFEQALALQPQASQIHQHRDAVLEKLG
ncbi:Tetratricopeptide repeat-containing protein [Gloeomargarita lithophora Alchichica-D10]|uniref:Tetratricopeptide repeat-containing protein n=1 Tax=Gloeomargarita lithophora Alchichica-D10 TaxID=1188229 RepID=A0A1J0ACS8_9CYAN|nr:tetratricopeptide repeat protein [Gloeomargarita lithophora]APB33723.1 Tetratricopeptide repeat-containing protein [Gloeomargarita lithophora Alchichica-D10]